MGEHLCDVVLELGKLESSHRILDVGSGLGRLAVALTKRMPAGFSFEGFDVKKDAVEWCQRQITRFHPTFQFTHVDVANAYYHPKGSVGAREVTFPYETGSFDVVVAFSVFTHLVAGDSQRYLEEISRVLSPNGKVIASFFLFEPDGRRKTHDPSGPRFEREMDGYWTSDPSLPERAIAYDSTVLTEMVERAGLAIVPPIHAGQWKAGEGLSYQDMVVMRKVVSKSKK